MNIETDLGKAINNIVALGNNLAAAQEQFVQNNLYDIFNMALDTGIKIALPEIVEDAVIDIKDALLENGFKLTTNKAFFDKDIKHRKETESWIFVLER